ncbi:MAG: response regulator, partial [Colwellia sp.]|nr:response regulator [Colwellia sp.]
MPWLAHAMDTAATPPLRFTTLAAPELNAIGASSSIIQDAQGFMWFTGYPGLVRYDGYHFKYYTSDADSPGSLSNANARGALIDHKGRLWLITEFGLNHYLHETERFLTYHYRRDGTQSHAKDNIFDSFVQLDSKRFIIGGRNIGLLVFDLDTLTFTPLAKLYPQHIMPHHGIRDIHQDRKGIIWVATFDQGLYALDLQSPTSQSGFNRHYPHHSGGLSHHHVQAIREDHRGHLWIATRGGGLNQLNPDTGVFTTYRNTPGEPDSLSHDVIWDLMFDKQQNLWVGTDKGLSRLLWDGQSYASSFERYRHIPGTTDSLALNNIRTFYQDRSGELWIGHYPSGISRVDRYASSFWVYRSVEHDPSTLRHNSVLSLAHSRDGGFWVGTEMGLHYLDRDKGVLEHYQHEPQNPNSLSANAVLSVIEDRQGRVWAGTWRGGLNRLDRSTGVFTHYLPKESLPKESSPSSKDAPNSLQNGEIWSLYEDSYGDVWAGSAGFALHRYRAQTDDFKVFNVSSGVTPGALGMIVSIFEDSQKRFWLGGVELVLFDRNTGKAQAIRHDPKDHNSIVEGAIYAVAEDRHGHLWLGPRSDDGVSRYDVNTGVFRNYRKKHGLAGNNVFNIVEDRQGQLWMTTNTGVSRLDPKQNSFKNFGQRQGLAGDVYSKVASLLSQRGEVLFGSSNGLTLINPEYLPDNTSPPPVVFTGFEIANKAVPIGAEGSPLTKSITYTKTLRLNHQQSVFSFTFAALNYVFPEENQYAYKMEGFEQQWQQVGTRRSATYTNLNPGHYRFRVKASNNEGVWNEQGASIELTILPPWWLTWWAKSLYALAALAMAWLFIYTLLQKKKAQYEHQVNQKLLDLDKVKDAFLANTSHELRTPLNGIIGLSESLIEGIAGQLPEAAQQNLKMIASSGRRLSWLINDILDFSKLQDHTLKLNRSAVDVYRLMEEILVLVQPLVGSKPLVLENHVDKYMSSLLADENRLQQILYNLIGNAIKFTERGRITVSADIIGSEVWFSVQDSGVGIAPENIETVFAAFEQEDTAHTQTTGGTGLGLAVTKQLVKLHGGDIEISSTVGEGTRVKFSLSMSGNVVAQERPEPKDNHQNTPVYSDSPTEQNGTMADESDKHSSSLEGLEQSANGHHILVVDDEPVNRRVLLNLLPLKNYRVTLSSSGVSALKLLENQDHGIDLILLDLMMPVMNGYEVCQRVRE